MYEPGLATILPNATRSLDGTGVLFGAGTSGEVGHPMMSALTRTVGGALKPDERVVLDEVLKAVGLVYADKNAKRYSHALNRDAAAER